MASEREVRTVERINLRNIINQWNANRLDLFELSEPNEDLEFHGVMRFYFQDADQKVVTKCIRVSSTASVHDVVCTLIEKFRPDIRMLSIPDYTDYALYEIHENGEERKLGGEEKPLLVQLNWHKDDREGRFLFRRMDEKSRLPSLQGESLRFGRKLSKREKRDKKKRDKKEAAAGRDGIAEKLYTELPETSFTRSISNPEAVMRRRRQQKLERKLQQFRQEGSPEAGGTLRIFGESLNRDVPYKTLLLSTTDTASHVVKEILDKYGLDQEEPLHYCLVQVLLPPVSPGEASPLDHPGQPGGGMGPLGSIQGVKEYILDDDDCPLAIERQHNRLKGTLSFHIRRRPADYQPRKRKKKPSSHGGVELPGPTSPQGLPQGNPQGVVPQGGFRCGSLYDRLPFLLAVHPDGGQPGPRHRILLNMTEVGSAPSGTQCLQLQGPGIHPRHCVIAHTEGVVTVTPSHQEAEIYLDGCRVYDTTILQHGALVRFGRHHTFRFLEPELAHRPHQNVPSMVARDGGYPPEYAERLVGEEDPASAYEGPPDAGETASVHSHRTEDAGPPPGGDVRRGDPILPAVLEFWEEHEAVFLEAVVGQLDWAGVQFKLAPTYTLYMACRYRASTHFRPEISPAERAQRLTALANHLGALVRSTVERRSSDPGPLALWLANASELLHFLRQDRHLSAYTLDAQDLLTEAVQLAFRHLVAAQRRELAQALPRAFLEARDPGSDSAVGEVLGVLAGSMSLLRRCRVNAALTIQLFSWLFHHVNMWLFNSLLAGSSPCNRQTGSLLKRRLAHLVAWAEKQGLELAADCHLARIIQAAHLLQTPKGSGPEEVASISSACFKLNSLQLRHLLECYEPGPDEAPVSPSLVEGVVRVAQQTADQQAHAEGRPLRLQEDPDLQLPFLLPEDGYSCDIVRGVPPGLQEFLQPLALSGLCRLTLQPTSLGYWTIYMSDQDVLGPPGAPEQAGPVRPQGPPRPSPPEVRGDGRGGPRPPEGPQVATITLHKSSNGMGLSIVAARGTNQDRLGIYIKSVVKGGAADQDGRLQAGDQLLRVDGHSLVGITQEKAADLMTQTGQVVNLEVAKQGAIHHGLAALLCQPSPLMHRVRSTARAHSLEGIPSPVRGTAAASALPPDPSPSPMLSGEANRGSSAATTSSSASTPDLCALRNALPPASSARGSGGGRAVALQWEATQTLDRSRGRRPAPTPPSVTCVPRRPSMESNIFLLGCLECEEEEPAPCFCAECCPLCKGACPEAESPPPTPPPRSVSFLDAGPRRLSERDIPSRLAQEDRGHPPGYRPRIQGSKSVPVLNTKTVYNSGKQDGGRLLLA
ncbi:afadin [Ixodes scapularis]